MYFILQEKISTYDYLDVINCDTLNLIRKYYKVLKEKYPTKVYRIVKGGIRV